MIATTAKLGSLTIKMLDCESMAGNQLQKLESMRPVLGSFNLKKKL